MDLHKWLLPAKLDDNQKNKCPICFFFFGEKEGRNICSKGCFNSPIVRGFTDWLKLLGALDFFSHSEMIKEAIKPIKMTIAHLIRSLFSEAFIGQVVIVDIKELCLKFIV
ncbi:hypothetical protein [Echinicola shivajiensis]|uniref:hypothetical protein n=1 Tax=Echinicola shivajiensis TaxID=1035916 RepID=UPI001BFC2BED|nr:hypothetical protein [Echinicola shivajiensis]